MDMRAYQQWLEEFDRSRGWNTFQDAHVLIHILEELGEVAREVQHLEQYRTGRDPETARANLAVELADVVTMTVKLAALHTIDLDAALTQLQEKCEHRFAVSAGQQETHRYWLAQKQLFAERAERYAAWAKLQTERHTSEAEIVEDRAEQ